MNRTHPFSSKSLFKPAIQLLASATTPLAQVKQQRRSPSVDSDVDIEEQRHEQASLNRVAMTSSTVQLQELGKSRNSSPHTRSSVAPSEDDDSEFEPATSLRPLVREHESVGARGRRRLMQGGLDEYLTKTWSGWQILVFILVAWSSATGFGMLLFNRFIMWSKFPCRTCREEL